MASLAFEFCLRPTGTTKKRSGLAGKRATALWRNVREPQKKERKEGREKNHLKESIARWSDQTFAILGWHFYWFIHLVEILSLATLKIFRTRNVI